uniref:Calcineurin-like phosphoesterase domain-containing protein n=1 Tax=Periophthalmus magnuspinnatus TaxID=409849 RepID=A0A3B4AFJ0_9GOBI
AVTSCWKGNWLLHFIRTRPCSFPASTTTNMSADPLFTFGVIADIQYADLDDGFNFTRTRKRYYRNSLQLLRNARDHWSEAPVQPEFVLQLGDIIDGFNTQQHASRSALDTVLREFGSSPVEVHHVWGNHEFYNFTRGELLCSELNRRLGESRPGGDIYAYSFSPYPGFCFIVLDAYDMSLLGLDQDSEQYQRALKLIQKYNGNQDLNQPPTTSEVYILIAYSNSKLNFNRMLQYHNFLHKQQNATSGDRYKHELKPNARHFGTYFGFFNI